MGHEVPKLACDAPDLPGAAFRAPVCERGHQRPADADGICPQRQRLVSVSAAFNAAINKYLHLAADCLPDRGQCLQGRRGEVHPPVVVGNHDACRAQVAADQRVMYAQHPLDDEGQAALRHEALQHSAVYRLHFLAQYHIKIALMVKAVVNIHADGQAARLVRVGDAAEYLVIFGIRLDDLDHRGPGMKDGVQLPGIAHAAEHHGTGQPGPLCQFNHAVAS